MNGCQFSVLIACDAPKTKIRIAAILISTMMLLVWRSLSRRAPTHSEPTTTSTQAVENGAGEVPGIDGFGWAMISGKCTPNTLSEDRSSKRKKTDPHRHVGNGVLENQIPADDPRKKFHRAWRKAYV